MAPSPTIPTSFVPKQPVHATARFTKSGGNTFLALSLFMLGVSLVSAGGVFAYEQYLAGVERAKSLELSTAEASVNAEAVEAFVRTRDRFSVAADILNSHVAVSRFFDLLESLTLTNVRYDTFSYTLLPDGSGEIELNGVARSFNALAAQSAAFSAEKNLKRTIFSGIQVGEDGEVNFTVSAEADPKLLEFSLSSAPVSSGQQLPAVQTTVVSTTTSATTTTP